MRGANGNLSSYGRGVATPLIFLGEDPAAYESRGEADVKIRAYRFCVSVVRWAGTVGGNKVSGTLMSQLLRAATSVGANIVESKSASSKRDFLRFREIALKSANETLFWLCLFRDGGLADRVVLTGFINELKEISAMLAAGIMTMKGKRE